MFSTIEQALQHLRHGGCVVVADDETRENEGDVIALASGISAASVNFMVRQACGLVCAAIHPHVAERLQLPPMVQYNQDAMGTAFTVSVDVGPERGVGTGISAHERATTLNHLADPLAKPTDFRRPGHIFPVVAREGGLLVRRGHTEAAVALAGWCLGEHSPAGQVAVMCEILNEDGTMARRDALGLFAKTHSLPYLHLGQLVDYAAALAATPLKGVA